MDLRRVLKILSPFFVIFAEGCSTIDFPHMENRNDAASLEKITPGDNARKTLELHGTGNFVFRCSADAKGSYWKFERPEANLFNKYDELVVRHSGPMQAFDHIDGSRIISSRIISWINPPEPEKNAKLVLMKTVADPGDRELSAVRFVQRLNTNGGMPAGNCSREQLGRLLKIPFSADFIFWK
jgi:hypothetical protein